MVFRAARSLGAGLLLPARLRTLDEDTALERRFDAGFALEAGLVFFVFDFVVFFDLLRAAIVKLSTRNCSRTRRKPAPTRSPTRLADFYLRNHDLSEDFSGLSLQD